MMRRSNQSHRSLINFRETLFLPDVDIYPVDDGEEETEQLLSQDSYPLEVQLDEGIAATDDDGYGYDVNSVPSYEYKLQHLVPTPTHIDSDDDDGGIACELCGRRFPNVCGLRTHKRSHKDDMVNLGQALYRGPSLNSNQSQPGKEVIDEEIGYPCGICKRSFSNIPGLRTHERFYGHASVTVTTSTSFQATKKLNDVKNDPAYCKPKKCIKTRRKNVMKTPLLTSESFTGRGSIHGPLEVPTRIANTSEGKVDFTASDMDFRNLNASSVSTSTRIAEKYVLRLNERPAFNDDLIVPDEISTFGSPIRPTRPYFKQNLMKNHGQPEISKYTRNGMFYECQLCGNRSLHINGFRSHWNRHVRDGDVTP